MATQIVSELEGVVNMVKDFRAKPLTPLFEAFVNSIQAIEDRFHDDWSKGEIKVVIHRKFMPPELALADSSRKEPDITGFEIIDNGVGFTEENFASFTVMASKHKASRGGKGIGRFTWLKAFESVSISSVYEGEEGKRFRRTIRFSLNEGIVSPSPQEVSVDTEISTTVSLNNFKTNYRKLQNAYRRTDTIAQRILEHCLFSFINSQAPKVIVEDIGLDGAKETCNLWKQYNEKIKPYISPDFITIGNERFDLVDIKLYGTTAQMHHLVLCADTREVETVEIGKMLGTSVQFDENGKKFVYAVYVTGEYLDSHVTPTRDEFSLPEESMPLDNDTPIGHNEILQAVVKHTKEFLKPYLDALQKTRESIVSTYVEKKNPALRAVAKYCPEALAEIDPNSSDEKIDEVLYHYKGKAEFEIRRNSEKLLKTQADSFNGSEERIKELAEKYDDFQKDNLAAYVTYRKFVIELFKKKISSRPDGSYFDENILHDIIFPRRTDSDSIGFDNHNLWLIDDRLAFHACAMSDKEIREFMESDSADRPDIVAFADVDPDTRVARTVSIIEFKKPNRTNYKDEKPPEQVQRMLRQIRENKYVLVDQGRPIHISQEDTQFLCYAICDFTKPILEWAEENDYAKMHGEFAYYYYNRNLNASIFLINLDKIAIDAQKRNFAFFEKLGIR